MTEVIVGRIYTDFERYGVATLGMAGSVSMISIIAFMSYLIFSKRFRIRNKSMPRTHVGVYILCFLVGELIKALACALNFMWAGQGGVRIGAICSLQGIVKQIGDVSTAVWSVIIALHLFNLFFWRFEPRLFSCIATCIAGWALTLTLVFIGPTVMKDPLKGDFYGIAGHWCWITRPYSSARYTLEYIWMFASALVSFLLYVATFLRIRGNIVQVQDRYDLRWVSTKESWRLKLTRDTIDLQIIPLVRILLWLPVVYILTILPMAICRLVEEEHDVHFAATFVTNIPFSLSGVFTIILMYHVANALPDHEQLPTFVAPRPNIKPEVIETGVEPFILPPMEEKPQEDSVPVPGMQSQRESARMEGSSMHTPPPVPTSEEMTAVASHQDHTYYPHHASIARTLSCDASLSSFGSSTTRGPSLSIKESTKVGPVRRLTTDTETESQYSSHTEHADRPERPERHAVRRGTRGDDFEL